MTVITTTADLAAACKAFALEPYITVDTEFLRETTYWPKLCLIQIGGIEKSLIVDVLADGISLEPFYALMTDRNVIKVFHAARQDIETMWHLGKIIPVPLFDTQIAASVLGFGEQVGYDQIVQQLTGHKIDKTQRFTNWAKRPLTKAQLDYAIDDVVHLREVYEKLKAQLVEKGRSSWVDDETAFLSDPKLYDADPERAWLRLRGRLRKPREVAIMIELAAWREREAVSRNVPRGRILKDDAMADIAQRPPHDEAGLGALRSVQQGFERSKDASAVLEAVKRGLARDPKDLPEEAAPQKRPQNGAAATVELLKVLLKKTAEETGVSAKMLATVDELEDIAMNDNPSVPSLKGWRYELFGEIAMRLKRGEIALTVHHGKVVSLSSLDLKHSA
ncbi:MAG: ribonuclease D [Pseudomonadota bacterium]